MRDDEILDLIAADPVQGTKAAIDTHGAKLLGRFHARAVEYNYGNANVEDVLQEAILKLLNPDERAEIRARGGSILAWLTQFGYWRLADHAKKATATYDESAVDLDRAAIERADAAQTAVSSKKPAQVALEGAWPRLSRNDKLVLSLKYGESRTDAEIAAFFGITFAAGKKRSHDARERLRKEMEIEGYDP